MASSQPQNPITRRLDRMVELWWQFESESSGSVGLWLLAPDEERMLEAFIRREESEGGQIPSVFWELSAPFEQASTYPQALLHQMLETCLELGNFEALAQAGFTEEFFESYQQRQGADAWLEFLDAFHQIMAPIAGHMVGFIHPQSVSDEDAYLQWLIERLEHGLPASVRLMLLDSDKGDRYERLTLYCEGKIHNLFPNLDMPAALTEMAAEAQAQSPHDPGIQYQAAFAALMQHSQKGDLEQARMSAEQARAIALKQNWPHLEVAAYLALAATETNQQAFDEAYRQYAHAIDRATQIEDQALRQRLTMQAHLGEGGARVADQDFEVAMAAYQAGANLALQLEDHVMALEAWRMVGYCAQQEKRWIDSWEAYQQGLQSATQIPADSVAHTTLPYLGHAMLEEVASKAGQTHQDKVKVMETLDKLLGADWQNQPLTSKS